MSHEAHMTQTPTELRKEIASALRVMIPDNRFKTLKAWENYCNAGADTILALLHRPTQDAAPAHGLTEEERRFVEFITETNCRINFEQRKQIRAIIDRLTGAQQ